MEEKKVCPECENREHKLEELMQEEAQQVAGGGAGKGQPHREVKCRHCGQFTYNGNFCDKCGKPL